MFLPGHGHVQNPDKTLKSWHMGKQCLSFHGTAVFGAEKHSSVQLSLRSERNPGFPFSLAYFPSVALGIFLVLRSWREAWWLTRSSYELSDCLHLQPTPVKQSWGLGLAGRINFLFLQQQKRAWPVTTLGLLNLLCPLPGGCQIKLGCDMLWIWW